MTKPPSEDLVLLRWLQEALEAGEVGIELQFLDATAMKKFRAKLVVARLKHPEYKPLAFLDMGDKLWIVRKEPNNGTEETHPTP